MFEVGQRVEVHNDNLWKYGVVVERIGENAVVNFHKWGDTVEFRITNNPSVAYLADHKMWLANPNCWAECVPTEETVTLS